LFDGGRLFVGAMGVLYFLSFGLQTEDYAWIKTTQALVFIGLDIPLGYFLNKLGEYKSMLLSLFFGIIGSLGYLLWTSFHGFLISEVFLALSLSTWPIALSAYSMRILEEYKTTGLVEKFFHLGDSISNVFVLVCGALGGLLYAYNKSIPYSCFLISYLFAMGFAVFYLKNIAVQKTEKGKLFPLIFSNLKEIKPVLSVVLILFLAQFLMQPLFHYWQPLFREKFNASSEEMSLIFIAYSLSMSTVSWSYSHFTHLSRLRSNVFIVFAAISGGMIYSLISQASSFHYALIFFALTFAIFNLVQIASSVLIQHKLNPTNRMILTKYVSFISRIGMILSLLLLHQLFANEWSTAQIYVCYGVLAILSFSFYLIGVYIQKKETEKTLSIPQ
ncbi:MAG: MFS transporter, partial [Silvanigrellaceae bacterium]|nr:MFS transporter [Silvanigrellaceae bacterium]